MCDLPAKQNLVHMIMIKLQLWEFYSFVFVRQKYSSNIFEIFILEAVMWSLLGKFLIYQTIQNVGQIFRNRS